MPRPQIAILRLEVRTLCNPMHEGGPKPDELVSSPTLRTRGRLVGSSPGWGFAPTTRSSGRQGDPGQLIQIR